MDLVTLRRRVARTRLAPVAAFPVRVSAVARHNAQMVGRSARWLASSREHTNYTYELGERNLEHLAWWVATITDRPVAEIRGFLAEVNGDVDLRSHVAERTADSARRGLADITMRLGRRAGWYALVRALEPEQVIETGTDKGLGSVVLAAALLRNGHGRLTTIDVNPESGYLVAGRYAEVTDRVIGDSVETLRGDSSPVDVFLHDSLHTPEYETAEFEAVRPRLTAGGLVLSDNAHDSDALSRWAERNRLTFSFFDERPSRHWYPGDGIGAAWRTGPPARPEFDRPSHEELARIRLNGLSPEGVRAGGQ